MSRSLFILLVGWGMCACQEQGVVRLNEEEDRYAIDSVGNVWSAECYDVEEDTTKSRTETSIVFQPGRWVIHFANGSSLILPSEAEGCVEPQTENDSCEEEYLLASICAEEDNSTVICGNDSSFWQWDAQIARSYEPVDSLQIHIKRFKVNVLSKPSQGKWVSAYKGSKSKSSF